jgi:hypothetical protein
MSDWARKAGRAKIQEKADAIYQAYCEAFDHTNRYEDEVLTFTLKEVINQCQNGQGYISSAELLLVAEALSDSAPLTPVGE